jgi:hypothetical protein
MHQRDNCDECFDWQAEAERLRAEWRKADDGWIACRQQLEGAVDALRALVEASEEFFTPNSLGAPVWPRTVDGRKFPRLARGAVGHDP